MGNLNELHSEMVQITRLRTDRVARHKYAIARINEAYDEAALTLRREIDRLEKEREQEIKQVERLQRLQRLRQVRPTLSLEEQMAAYELSQGRK